MSRTRRPQAHRAALAGASGLVGRALAAQWTARPDGGELTLLLRRPLPVLQALPQTRVLDWHGGAMPALPPIDTALCALGTTIRAAGSQAAFRAVDFDAVLAFARAARSAGATCLGVVSALGADAASRVFYNRVKGEMEQAVADLGFERLVIARPSLLLGDRLAIGQPPRAGEGLAQWLAPVLAWATPARLRAISADDVAAGLLAALALEPAGRRVVESDELRRLAVEVAKRRGNPQDGPS